jgi:predicted dehydrogenase
MKTIVVGCGSIGRRHLKNLDSLGIKRLFACDPDKSRLEEVQNTLPVEGFTDLDMALESVEPDAVVICTPPSMHVDQALQAARRGANLFIEKPLSDSLESISDLTEEAQKNDCIVQVGYNLRYHPGIAKIKNMLDGGAIGRVMRADIEFGFYLPDWRPWQDYRKSYTANRTLGGGIILDDTHELDYPIWFFGSPIDLVCSSGRMSDLEMDVEDSADMIIRFAGGIQATIRIDCVQRVYSRHCTIIGTQGTIRWDYSQNRIEVFKTDCGKWDAICYEFDPNDMYMLEMQDFISRVEAGSPDRSSYMNACTVLRTALAARRSSADSCWVSID